MNSVSIIKCALEERMTAENWEEIRHWIEDKSLFEKAKTFAFEYMDSVEQRNVYPDAASLENLSGFNESFPEEMGDGDQIIETLHRLGSPATVAQTGRRYFGFVNGGVTPPALAAKWLADVWDQNAGLYVISPVSAHLESVCESWLKTLFGLPGETVAGFVPGTSMATLCGLLTARNHLLEKNGWDIREKGLFGAPQIRVVLGEQAHSTVFKALSVIGFGMGDIEKIPVDENGAMLSGKMPHLDGRTLVVAQAGNVNTGAFDDFEEICQRADQAGAWVHIDGAFGLWAAGSEKKKHLVKGIERADSWSVDAHKTLNAPYDCGVVLCRHKESMISALQNTGAYIQYSGQRDGMLYTTDMSRRARSPELWATLKFFGQKGVARLVDDLCEKAQEFARQLKDRGFNVLNNVVFNQVLVGCQTDALTRKTLEHLQKGKVLWAGGSEWQGRAAIRISICSWATTMEDVTICADEFVRARVEARVELEAGKEK